MRRMVASILMSLFTSFFAYGAEYVKGELLVKYQDNAKRDRLTAKMLYDSMDVKSIKRFTGVLGMGNSYEHWILNDTVNVDDVISRLKKVETIAFVQPNYILKSFQEPRPYVYFAPLMFTIDLLKPIPSTPPAEVIPPIEDPETKVLWAMRKIQAVDAWKFYRGSKNIIVAVIDTGVDYNHEDLSFNMWRNPAPTQGDVVGYDFIHNDGLPFDDNENGTHLAGVIGGVGGNGIGIAGVSQIVSLMAVKFLSNEGSGTSADAIRSIDYAVAHGARILSTGWGGSADDGENLALREAIEIARNKGALLVAAAGKEGNDVDRYPVYPASFQMDNIFTAAETDETDEFAYFSNYGVNSVHIGAPGSNIYSTLPGNRYAAFSGTSLAAAHLAGASALIWSKHPDWNYLQVKKTLMKNSDPLPSLNGRVTSGGRLNVLKAIRGTSD